MWELDHKEAWELKNRCLLIVVLEKILESPLDCKEIKPVNSKENKPWIFIRRTDAEIEAQILWPPDAKSQPTGKDLMLEKDWGQEKGAKEVEMVLRHHWLNGHEFEQTQGDSEGQGGLACCSPRGHKEWTRFSNWTTTICFTHSSVYVSVLLSIHPTLSFPTVYTSLFSMSASLFLPCK